MAKADSLDLLPTTHQDFGSTAYWDQFFKKRGTKAFEWYGEYTQLCGILHKYIRPADCTLVVGCGNSTLSADLYDVGYENLVNIDISEMVIKQMTEKHRTERPNLTFTQMDMLETTFEDGSFGAILDKGTLDALMTDESAEVVERIDKMFGEINRILKLGGRYVCVSLAQHHILQKVVTYFSELGWPIRVCRVEDDGTAGEQKQKEFYMPVFVFVITKFKKMPNMKQILEVCHFQDKVQRLETSDALIQAVKSMQYYGIVRHRLGHRRTDGDPVCLDLYSADSTSPRYTLHVVDSTTKSSKKFAVFIVPSGRETEWLFSSEAGRDHLVKSAGFDRLVIVSLHPDHTYKDLQQVQDELSSKVMELAPSNVGNAQVPFLSLGDDINKSVVCHRGRSDLSGEFVIEDVDMDGETRRRLIFLSSRSIVQSEARMVREKTEGGARKKGKKRKLVVDTSHLCEPHHLAMVAGLAFIHGLPQCIDTPLNGVLVGLGGGGLASFLNRFFPQLCLDCVELDPEIGKVAEKWFGLTPGQNLRVHFTDGLKFLRQLQEKGDQQDVIIIDVDNKDLSAGMTSPPKEFVEMESLKCVDSLLKPHGVLILNTSCRNTQQCEIILSSMQQVFHSIYIQKIPEHVNQIVYALPSSCTKPKQSLGENAQIPEDIKSALPLLQDRISVGIPVNNVADITNSLDGLTLL